MKVSEDVEKCLRYAGESIEADWVPLSRLEAATEENARDVDIPITFQNHWFCLHGEEVQRPLENGRTKTTVSFPSTMVERDPDVVKVLQAAKGDKGREELATLCRVHPSTVRQWISGDCNVPLSGVMKACQVVDRDHWKLLDGVRLCGKTYSILHREERSTEEQGYLEDLIDWINTEGHIRLEGWSFSITQDQENRELLERPGRRIEEIFDVHPDCIKIYNREGLSTLTVDSAALRQLLVLRYNIRPGKKSHRIDIDTVNFRRVANYLSAEGGFFFNGHGLAVEVVWSDSKKIRRKLRRFLSENGFTPSSSGKSVMLTRMEESLRFLVEVWEHLTETKRRQAEAVLQKPETFGRLRANTEEMRPLLDSYLKENSKEDLHELVNSHGSEFGISYSDRSLEHWMYPGDERDIPLFVVKAVCDEGYGDIDDYVDDFILEAFSLAGRPL